MAIRDFRSHSKKFFRDRRPLAAVEMLVAVAIVAGQLVELIPFSSTPFLLLFGWLMLWLRGVGWRDVGLRRPASWSRVLLPGVLYLGSGRNLWAAIIAHGVNDTIGFTLIYPGKYPGL